MLRAAAATSTCWWSPIGGGGLITGIGDRGARDQAGHRGRRRADRALPGGVERDARRRTVALRAGDDRRRHRASSAPGALTLPLIRERVDDVLLVGEDDIEQAILMLLEIEKTVVEGAGARRRSPRCSKHRERFAGRKVGLVLSGGNIEPLVLAEIIERGMVRVGPPGATARWTCATCPARSPTSRPLLGRLGANIEEVQHQRAFTTLSVERAQIEVVVHTRDVEHIEEVLAAMREQGYRAERVRSA